VEGRVFVIAAAIAIACSREGAPLGEAVLVVDTDMPVPKIVSRLRVDVFSEDGTWIVSRDIAATGASDWPISFSVYAPDPTRPHVALVRLRAYPDGYVREYRGERFRAADPNADPLVVPAESAATNEPRIKDSEGRDVTPRDEPNPFTTIDRLVRVRLREGERGLVHVTLRGACERTMADLKGLRTCVDQEGQLASIADSPLEPYVAEHPPPSILVGAFGTDLAKPCQPRPATDPFSDEVCVAGGVFILGSHDSYGAGAASDLPERVASIPTFAMDKYEMTVGRYRAALAKGFVPMAKPTENELPIPTVTTTGAVACTYSVANLGRESMPLNCIVWQTARDLCRFYGGDLPSEAEWEYAATMADRTYKSRYAWGGSDNAYPRCDKVVFARSGTNKDCNANNDNFGPVPVDVSDVPGGDLFSGLGIVALGGSVAEMTVDTFASMSSNCWLASSLMRSECDAASGDYTTRGGSWRDSVSSLVSSRRLRNTRAGAGEGVGLRCVRRMP
jgi:formylglycine-generating enzyme required for sulfatase activity